MTINYRVTYYTRLDSSTWYSTLHRTNVCCIKLKLIPILFSAFQGIHFSMIPINQNSLFKETVCFTGTNQFRCFIKGTNQSKHYLKHASQSINSSIPQANQLSNEITGYILTRRWPRSCSWTGTWARVHSRCQSDRGTILAAEESSVARARRTD